MGPAWGVNKADKAASVCSFYPPSSSLAKIIERRRRREVGHNDGDGDGGNYGGSGRSAVLHNTQPTLLYTQTHRKEAGKSSLQPTACYCSLPRKKNTFY